LYYNLGAERSIYSDSETASAASHAFVDYVDSLIDPNESLDQSVTEYHESKYH
jgi:hypothetical protein